MVNERTRLGASGLRSRATNAIAPTARPSSQPLTKDFISSLLIVGPQGAARLTPSPESVTPSPRRRWHGFHRRHRQDHLGEHLVMPLRAALTLKSTIEETVD